MLYRISLKDDKVEVRSVENISEENAIKDLIDNSLKKNTTSYYWGYDYSKAIEYSIDKNNVVDYLNFYNKLSSIGLEYNDEVIHINFGYIRPLRCNKNYRYIKSDGEFVIFPCEWYGGIVSKRDIGYKLNQEFNSNTEFIDYLNKRYPDRYYIHPKVEILSEDIFVEFEKVSYEDIYEDITRLMYAG